MISIDDIPTEVITMAAGCVRGDWDRVLALILVCFGDTTERDAQIRTGVEKTMIRRDRHRFREAFEKYGSWRERRHVIQDQIRDTQPNTPLDRAHDGEAA